MAAPCRCLRGEFIARKALFSLWFGSILMVSFGGCATSPPADPSAPFREKLWAEIGTVSEEGETFRAEREGGQSIAEGKHVGIYLDTYDLRPGVGVAPDWRVRLGVLGNGEPPLGLLMGFPSGGDKGSPPARGTVFLVHGYLDHSGAWAPVIKKMMDRGYVVVAMDLPGHGFSGGKRGDIEDFSLYGEAVGRVIRWARKVSPSGLDPLFPRPWIAVGHSTGASAIWIYLVKEAQKRSVSAGQKPENWGEKNSAFDEVVFLAPLVRSAHWHASMVFVSLTSWAIPYWKSRAAEDPLFWIPYFPLRWATKLSEWETRTRDYPVLERAGWILQGTKDSVVDFRYSVPFLVSKLPHFQARYIEGAGHVPYVDRPAEERFVEALLEILP